jgi:protease II
MGAGHRGPSGRLGSVNDTAGISAWLLAQAARAGQR